MMDFWLFSESKLRTKFDTIKLVDTNATAHGGVIFDTNKSYKEYLMPLTNNSICADCF